MVILWLAACGPTDRPATRTWWADWDGDGYGDPWSDVDAAEQPEGYVDNHDDCDDTQAAAHPGGVEVCDLFDNDCDGWVDNLAEGPPYIDGDGDGYGDLPYCGGVELGGDCAAGDPTIHPGATETCDDGVDSNCDGIDCTTAERGYDGRISDTTDELSYVGWLASLPRASGDRLVISTYTGEIYRSYAFDAPIAGERSFADAAASLDDFGAIPVAFPDLDGDGLGELASNVAEYVSELRSGTLDGSPALATFDSFSADAVGDLDGDGATDLVGFIIQGTYTFPGTLYVHRGPLSGSYASADAWATVETDDSFIQYLGHYTVASDGDGDGVPELYGATSTYGDNINSVYRWDLQSGGTRSTLDADAVLVVHDVANQWIELSLTGAGDLDGDGLDDLVFGLPVAPAADGTEGVGKAWLLPADPRGEADLEEVAPAVWEGQVEGDQAGANVAIGDFNGDGAVDLALGGVRTPVEMDPVPVELYAGPITPGAYGIGEGDWQWRGPRADLSDGRPLAAGDFDGDGVDDLAAGGWAPDLDDDIDAVYVLADILR